MQFWILNEFISICPSATNDFNLPIFEKNTWNISHFLLPSKKIFFRFLWDFLKSENSDFFHRNKFEAKMQLLREVWGKAESRLCRNLLNIPTETFGNFKQRFQTPNRGQASRTPQGPPPPPQLSTTSTLGFCSPTPFFFTVDFCLPGKSEPEGLRASFSRPCGSNFVSAKRKVL